MQPDRSSKNTACLRHPRESGRSARYHRLRVRCCGRTHLKTRVRPSPVSNSSSVATIVLCVFAQYVRATCSGLGPRSGCCATVNLHVGHVRIAGGGTIFSVGKEVLIPLLAPNPPIWHWIWHWPRPRSSTAWPSRHAWPTRRLSELPTPSRPKVRQNCL